ncbi:MAG: MarC family protein [Holophaga sp.]|nr:MarC family protein [Holophaga sp.]
MQTTFLSATLLLVLTTDPLGNIPLFISTLEKVKPERRFFIITREVLIALAVLLLFMLFGQGFLALLHLSDEALSVAGGVILLLIAIDMVFPHRRPKVEGAEPAGEPFIVPLAIPVISGPSAMATVLLLSSRNPGRRLEWAGAICLTMAIVYLVFLLAIRLRKLLGAEAITAMERLMGLVLTALAVEMLLGGVTSYIRDMPVR